MTKTEPWLLRLARAPRGPWLLLLAIAVLRAPGFFFGPLDIDETDLVHMGRIIGDGGIPYVDFVEKKPVFLYLFYLPAAVFGWHMWPMQLLAILWVFATSVVIGRAARRYTGRDDVGAAAAWLCALASSCNVLSVNAELLLNLPAAAALLFFVRAEMGGTRRDDFLAGLCVALATLFKHQAGIVLVALELALVYGSVRQGRGPALARHAAVLAGFVLPWAATAGVYAALGNWAEFFEWNVTRNLFYAGFGAGSALLRFAQSFGTVVVAAAPLLWWAALVETRRGPRGDTVRFLLLASVWLVWVPVSLGGRFYEHYFLQFAPPLALLAAPYVTELAARRRKTVSAALALPVFFFFVYAVVRGVIGGYPCQDPKTIELAAFLRAHAPREARVFVWGNYTPIYYLAERRSGTRYLSTATHVGDFDPGHLPPGFDLTPYKSQRVFDGTLADLEKNRPELAVDTTPSDIHQWSKVPIAIAPEIRDYVALHYREIGRPAGAIVYRRKNDQRLP